MASTSPPPPPPPCPPPPPPCPPLPSHLTDSEPTLQKTPSSANTNELSLAIAPQALSLDGPPRTNSGGTLSTPPSLLTCNCTQEGECVPPPIPLHSSSIKQDSMSVLACSSETAHGGEMPLLVPTHSSGAPLPLPDSSPPLPNQYPTIAQGRGCPVFTDSDPPSTSSHIPSEEMLGRDTSSPHPSSLTFRDKTCHSSTHSSSSVSISSSPLMHTFSSNTAIASEGQHEDKQTFQPGTSMEYGNDAMDENGYMQDDHNVEYWLSRMMTRSTSSRNLQDEHELQRIQAGIEKLKKARIQKEVLKVYAVDGSSKLVTVSGDMTAQDLCFHLADRFNREPGPNWTIVEKLPSLHIERVLEDHEKVLRALWHWPRFSEEEYILFKNNPEKYYITKRPQLFVPETHQYSSYNPDTQEIPDKAKGEKLIQELFVEEWLPVVKGEVHIKEGRKGSWKKHHAILKRTGLYFSKGDKMECTDESVEWKCIECYTGNEYVKVYKSPTPYCLSLVPNGPLNDVECKITHICVSSKHSLTCWMTAIRLIKHGAQLYKNYQETTLRSSELLPEEDYKSSSSGEYIINPETIAQYTLANTESSQNGSIEKMKMGRLTSRRKPSVLAAAFAHAWKDTNLILAEKASTNKVEDFRISNRPGTQLFSVDSGMYSLKTKYQN